LIYPFRPLTVSQQRREFLTMRGPILVELATTGTMYVGFTDSRDATKAFEKIQARHPNWEIHPLTAEEYGKKSNESASHFKGQIDAKVTWDPANPELNLTKVAFSFKTLLMTFGDLKGLQSVPMGPGRLDVVAEFYDSRAVGNAVRTLNGSFVDVSVSFSYFPSLLSSPHNAFAFIFLPC
jgi:hypothetical protein